MSDFPQPGEPTPDRYRGQFGLCRISGIGGRAIELAQLLAGDTSAFQHAFGVLDDSTVVQGEPGGANMVPLADYLGRTDVAFSHLALPDDAKECVMAEFRKLEGMPYAYLAYPAMGAAALGIEPRFLLRYLGSHEQAECAQLVDIGYQRAGVELFADGLPPGLVDPGDLTVLLFNDPPVRRPRRRAWRGVRP